MSYLAFGPEQSRTVSGTFSRHFHVAKMEIRNQLCNRETKVFLFLIFFLFFKSAESEHGFTGKAWKVTLS